MLAGSLFVGVHMALTHGVTLGTLTVPLLVPEQACWRAACSWACTWR